MSMRELVKGVAHARMVSYYPCCGVSRSVARKYGHRPGCPVTARCQAQRAALATLPEGQAHRWREVVFGSGL